MNSSLPFLSFSVVIYIFFDEIDFSSSSSPCFPGAARTARKRASKTLTFWPYFINLRDLLLPDPTLPKIPTNCLRACMLRIILSLLFPLFFAKINNRSFCKIYSKYFAKTWHTVYIWQGNTFWLLFATRLLLWLTSRECVILWGERSVDMRETICCGHCCQAVSQSSTLINECFKSFAGERNFSFLFPEPANPLIITNQQT